MGLSEPPNAVPPRRIRSISVELDCTGAGLLKLNPGRMISPFGNAPAARLFLKNRGEPKQIVWHVSGGRLIENVRETSGAGLKSELPACEAVMVQVPDAVRVTTAPFTTQEPLAANETGRPELAVADTVNGGSPKVLFASGSKRIVWLRPSISKLKIVRACGPLAYSMPEFCAVAFMPTLLTVSVLPLALTSSTVKLNVSGL